MQKRTNPFNPNSIVTPLLFAGRGDQVLHILKKLTQVREGMPASFVLQGDRGIGKTAPVLERRGYDRLSTLMLSIVYKGIAIPLFWTLLAKRGNSNTSERLEIIQRFIKQFGKSMVSGLLADREFIGDNWFAWL